MTSSEDFCSGSQTPFRTQLSLLEAKAGRLRTALTVSLDNQRVLQERYNTLDGESKKSLAEIELKLKSNEARLFVFTSLLRDCEPDLAVIADTHLIKKFNSAEWLPTKSEMSADLRKAREARRKLERVPEPPALSPRRSTSARKATLPGDVPISPKSGIRKMKDSPPRLLGSSLLATNDEKNCTPPQNRRESSRQPKNTVIRSEEPVQQPPLRLADSRSGSIGPFVPPLNTNGSDEVAEHESSLVQWSMPQEVPPAIETPPAPGKKSKNGASQAEIASSAFPDAISSIPSNLRVKKYGGGAPTPSEASQQDGSKDEEEAELKAIVMKQQTQLALLHNRMDALKELLDSRKRDLDDALKREAKLEKELHRVVTSCLKREGLGQGSLAVSSSAPVYYSQDGDSPLEAHPLQLVGSRSQDHHSASGTVTASSLPRLPEPSLRLSGRRPATDHGSRPRLTSRGQQQFQQPVADPVQAFGRVIAAFTRDVGALLLEAQRSASVLQSELTGLVSTLGEKVKMSTNATAAFGSFTNSGFAPPVNSSSSFLRKSQSMTSPRRGASPPNVRIGAKRLLEIAGWSTEDMYDAEGYPKSPTLASIDASEALIALKPEFRAIRKNDSFIGAKGVVESTFGDELELLDMLWQSLSEFLVQHCRHFQLHLSRLHASALSE